jgi:hypothetical protein
LPDIDERLPKMSKQGKRRDGTTGVTVAATTQEQVNLS